MKRLSGLLLTLLLLASCARQQPVYTAVAEMPIAAQSLPLRRIEALIIAGAQQRAWRVQPQGQGQLVATQQSLPVTATVDIIFDRRQLRIAYRDSQGLNAHDGLIHPRYNTWVRNLQGDILARLATGQ